LNPLNYNHQTTTIACGEARRGYIHNPPMADEMMIERFAFSKKAAQCLTKGEESGDMGCYLELTLS